MFAAAGFGGKVEFIFARVVTHYRSPTTLLMF
jgi:hypothetical protein